MTTFNKGKGSNAFPIKQHRFDTTNHPVHQVTEKRSSRIQVKVTAEENKMLQGLARMVEGDETLAFRIALYEAQQAQFPDLLRWSPYASMGSTRNGHKNRRTKLTIAVTSDERSQLQALAADLQLQEMECARLLFIWLSKSVRSEKKTRLAKSKKRSQLELLKKWDAETKDTRTPGSKLAPMREAYAKRKEEIWEEEDELYELHGELIHRALSEGVIEWLWSDDDDPYDDKPDKETRKENLRLLREYYGVIRTEPYDLKQQKERDDYVFDLIQAGFSEEEALAVLEEDLAEEQADEALAEMMYDVDGPYWKRYDELIALGYPDTTAAFKASFWVSPLPGPYDPELDY